MPEPNTLSHNTPDPEPESLPRGAVTAGWVPPPEPDAPSLGTTQTNQIGSTPGPSRPDQRTRTDDTERITAEKIDPDALPQVPGYRVEKLIGRGGMATVYRAVHVEMDRVVALKLINPGGRDEFYVRERFEREVQTLASVEHPNVVNVYNCGNWHGFPFLTMKFIPRGPLSQHLADFRGKHQAAARLVVKVARGVQALHDAGILHRDLKPLNILLTSDDEPLVADFGLAKWIDEVDSDLTVTHVPLGTRQYMSPEQTLGQKSRYAAACDIWALGVVLYELLAGSRPFSDSDTTELFEQIRTAEPAPLPFATPTGLEAVVWKCLAKEPDDRYPTAAAVAEDLERWLAGRPVTAPPPPARQPAPSTPTWLVATGVVALLALIFLPAILIPFGKASEVLTPVVKTNAPPTPKVQKKPIHERLLARETVVLIDEKGEPLETFRTLSRSTGSPGRTKSGFELVTQAWLAVQFDYDPVPFPIQIEAEYMVSGLHPVRSGGGVFVGGKEVLGPAGMVNTLFALFETQQYLGYRWHFQAYQEHAAFALLAWNEQDGPEKHARSGMIQNRLASPSQDESWQTVKLVLQPDALSGQWNRLNLPPVLADEKGITSRYRAVAKKYNVPEALLTQPAFGSGIGLCAFDAQVVFRNVKLVPLNQP